MFMQKIKNIQPALIAISYLRTMTNLFNVESIHKNKVAITFQIKKHYLIY